MGVGGLVMGDMSDGMKVSADLRMLQTCVSVDPWF